ncbi:MAG: DUF2791 family P-loop domain-containing protein [Methanoregula sp.]|nr:DUF2791 family P-loop domain-containing protein [Methanoregula sp.]
MDDEDKFLQKQYKLKNKKEVFETFKDKVAKNRDLHLWVDRDEESEKWNNIIKESSEIDKNYIVFIIGNYGRGKSLSILKILNESKKYPNISSVYLNLLAEEAQPSALTFIFRIFKNLDFYKLSKGKKYGKIKIAIDKIPSQYTEVKKILHRIYFGPQKSEQAILFDDNLDFQIQDKSDISKNALFFLRGEITPNASLMKALGVSRKIENIDLGKEYLAGILFFMRNLGYHTLLLGIDEFESLFSLVPKSKQSKYTALLRGLYDLPSELDIKPQELANIVFFISISESGWSGLKEMRDKEASIGGPTQPLLDRVDAEITLSVLNKESTSDLISKRLHYNRIDDSVLDKPLIPFNEGFVNYIYDKTGGEPRMILTRCSQVLDAGLKDRAPLLTAEYAQKVLEKRGFQ